MIDPSTTTLINSSEKEEAGASSALSSNVAVAISSGAIVIALISAAVIIIHYRRNRKRNIKFQRAPNPSAVFNASDMNQSRLLAQTSNSYSFNSMSSASGFMAAMSAGNTTNTISITSGNSFIKISKSQKIHFIGSSMFYVPGYRLMKYGVDFEMPRDPEKIGSGGTASLYVGELINTQIIASNGFKRDVAVKVFKIDPSNSKSFYYEVGILAGLKGHPNVIELIGYTEHPFYSMIMKKYKCSLQHVLDEGQGSIGILPKSFASAMLIARDIVSGMKAIHSKGLLHLDLKPLNVLIDEYSDSGSNGTISFRCVICDFGSSSIIGEVPKVTGFIAPENMGFTVRYTPPEVFRRLLARDNTRPSTEYDKKIDVYAFAITMYEVITREKAFAGMNANEVLESFLQGKRPKWPESLLSENAGYIQMINLVNSCWQEDPTLRLTFDTIQNKLLQGAPV